MIFKSEFIPKIIDGSKSQTRRLVKKDEYIAHSLENFEYEFEVLRPSGLMVAKKGFPKVKYKKIEPVQVCDVRERIKWQVGRTYAVQEGRGEKGIWYCSKCLNYFDKIDAKTSIGNGWYQDRCPKCREHFEISHLEIKPLRIRITALWKERLLDITEEDSKKEGFETMIDFLAYFYLLYNKSFQFEQDEFHFVKKFKAKKWNPEVWVLNFQKVEE